MKRLQLTVLVLGFMCLVVYISKTTVPTADPKPKEPKPQKRNDTLEEALGRISAESCRKTVEFLASDELEGRMSGKKGNVKAASHIKDAFESCGYKTQYQRFKISKVNPGHNNEDGDDFTQNILAWSL